MVDADYTEPRAVTPGNARTKTARRYFEIPVVILSLFAGAAFLTKMCYLSLAFNTIFVIVFLAVVYFYVRARLNIKIPVVAFRTRLCWHCRLMHSEISFTCTGSQFGPMQYDEFAHMMVQVLVSPIIVWLSGGAAAGRLSIATQTHCLLCCNYCVQPVSDLRDHRVVG